MFRLYPSLPRLWVRTRPSPCYRFLATRSSLSSSQSTPQAAKPPAKTAAPPLNRPRRDEEITARKIQFVNAQGELEGIKPLTEVLGSFDRSTYWLLEVDPRAQPPVCRLVTKKDLYEKQRARRKATKPTASVLKELSFAWTVAPHDLAHKMEKAREILSKGHKLELRIVSKAGRRVPQPEQEKLMSQILGELDEYSRVIKPVTLTKSVGMVTLQGKAISKDKQGESSE
ncbi:uncharacterized protein VTP21DRAFT_1150 [Calcarisporiella thermophila]|uniref:uncharacterized protein n=1 Tax=Calcarisporiella thermophila TaxID=911321 RepID=UPI003742FB56